VCCWNASNPVKRVQASVQATTSQRRAIQPHIGNVYRSMGAHGARSVRNMRQAKGKTAVTISAASDQNAVHEKPGDTLRPSCGGNSRKGPRGWPANHTPDSGAPRRSTPATTTKTGVLNVLPLGKSGNVRDGPRRCPRLVETIAGTAHLARARNGTISPEQLMNPRHVRLDLLLGPLDRAIGEKPR